MYFDFSNIISKSILHLKLYKNHCNLLQIIPQYVLLFFMKLNLKLVSSESCID